MSTPDGNGVGAQLGSATRERGWPPSLPKRLALFEADYLDTAAGVAVDLGGISNLTTQQRAVAEATLEVRVLRRKVGRNLLARGVVRRSGELRHAAKFYVALVNAERQGWLALGLTRAARRVDSYVAEVLERQRGDGRAAGPQGSDLDPQKGEGAARGPALSGPGVPSPAAGGGESAGGGPDPVPGSDRLRGAARDAAPDWTEAIPDAAPGSRSGAGARILVDERGHGRRGRGSMGCEPDV